MFLRRRFIFLSIPLLLFCITIFHRPLICFVLKQAFARHITLLKGTKPSYGHLGYNEGVLYLDHIHFFHPSRDADVLYIEKVECRIFETYAWRPSYKLIKPSLQCYQEREAFRWKKMNLYKVLSLPQLVKKLTIEQGEITYITKESSCVVTCSFIPGSEGTHMGSMVFGMDHHQQEHLKMHLHKVGRNILVQMEYEKMPLTLLEALSSHAHIHLEKGIVSGEFQLGITAEGKLHSLKSDLEVDNLTLAHQHTLLHFEECRMRMILPTDHQDKIDLNHLTLPMMMRYLVSTCEVTGGQLYFNHPQTHSLWEVSDLEGMLTCNLAHTPSLSLRGRLEKDHALYPFILEGKGLIESEQNWWMDIEMGSLSQESFKGEIAHKIPLYIALLDGEEYFMKAGLYKLQAPAVRIIQELCSLWVPSLGAFAWEQGTLSTDVIVRMQERKINTIAFEALSCHGITGVWREKQLKVSCEEIAGKGKLHFPLLKSIKAPMWEMTFQGLVLNNSAGAFLLESSGSLSSKDWKLASSWIKTRCQGIEGVWNLSGSYSDVEVSGSLFFGSQHLASSLQEEVLAVAPHLQPLEKMDCSLKVKYTPQELHIGGVSYLGYASSWVDKIRFGMTLSLEQWLQKGGSRATSSYAPTRFTLASLAPEGWFQSDELSENTYLWFIKYYHQHWHALGKMQVTGEFNPYTLHFTLESKDALYESEDISVKIGEQSISHTGDFTFDLQRKIWKVHLPIVKGACVDKRFHLPFENVRADVRIEGTQLAAEHVEACCENVNFSGRLDVDFTDPQWVDLKLYPSKMCGDVQDFIRFMHYLPGFQSCELPLTGKVEGEPTNYLFTRYNLTESISSSKIALKVREGSSTLNAMSSVHHLGFDLLWDSSQQLLEIKDLVGDVNFIKDEESRHYRFNVPTLISKNILTGEWEFDVRLESATLDVLRCIGHTQKTPEGDITVFLEPHLTHLFGAKMEQIALVMTPSLKVKTFAIEGAIPAIALMQTLQCCYLGGFLESSSSWFQKIKDLKTEGNLLLKFAYNHDQDGQKTLMLLQSPLLVFNDLLLHNLSLRLLQEGPKWKLEHFKTDNLFIEGEAYQQGGHWDLSDLAIQWKNSSMRLHQGVYEKGVFKVQVEQMMLSLQECLALAGQEQETFLWKGWLSAQGALVGDCSQGINAIKISSELNIVSSEVGSAQLEVTSQLPIHISYTPQEGIEIDQLSIYLQKKEIVGVWATVAIGYLHMYPHEKTLIAKGIHMVLPPEMFRYLVEKKCIPHVEHVSDTFRLFDKTFKWENQLETEFNFAYDPHSLQLQGVVKDGYYWVGEKSVYFQNIHFFLDQDQLNFALGWDYQDISLDFLTQIQLRGGIEALKEGVEAKVMIKEGHVAEQDGRPSLDLLCRYDPEEGLYVQSLEGTLYGIDFSFRRNPRTYLPDVMVLTGQMKIDTAGLVRAFPTLFYQTIKDLGMGSGYELSGDWVLSKKEHSSSYFKGFLKGRDFEFLGFYFKTLLSEVEINSQGITVHDFRLSDLSGVAQMKAAYILKSEEDGSWQLQIPEIMVQDFRPSFLKTIEGREERIKPFVIKDLHFFNIQGTLGYKESFSGEGYLDFINTFKRDTNLLDLPIEIIGRIGFDLGLFVPVIGKLEFEMTEGKIFLKELANAYSEGKRSRFYLSGYRDSYIGLDGSIFIDIKMKQYVLLKITQPFTLSIRGSLTKPKYSLR